MRVSFSYTFNAPAAKVWTTILDPETIARCMPGCQALIPLGDDQYEAALSVGVGSIKASYKAKITLADQVPTTSYKLKVEGNGSPGFVNGEASISLSEEGQTTILSVAGDAQVGGTIARVGQRLLGTVNQRMMDNFFNCLKEAVSANK